MLPWGSPTYTVSHDLSYFNVKLWNKLFLFYLEKSFLKQIIEDSRWKGIKRVNTYQQMCFRYKYISIFFLGMAIVNDYNPLKQV